MSEDGKSPIYGYVKKGKLWTNFRRYYQTIRLYSPKDRKFFEVDTRFLYPFYNYVLRPQGIKSSILDKKGAALDYLLNLKSGVVPPNYKLDPSELEGFLKKWKS